VLVWFSAGTLCPAETHLQVAADRVVLPHLSGSDVSAYPSIDRLSDGRLFAVFSAAIKEREGKFVLASSISTDDGRSWSKPEVLIDTQDGQDYDPSVIVIGERIIVTATTTPIAEKGITTSRTMAVRSDDSGRRWSPPYEIATGRRYTSGKINNGIVLQDGTALLGYTWEKNLEDPAIKRLSSEGEMEEVNAVLVSFDQGSTWTSSQSVHLAKRRDQQSNGAINGVCEPALVECEDGSVFMLSRTGLKNLYGSRSEDGGRSWTAPEPTSLVSHNAPAAVCKFGGQKAGGDKFGGHRPGVFAVWNNSPTDRWPLSAAVSLDDCCTWSAATEIANQPGLESSYPGCIQARDGSIVVVYQQATKAGRDIVCARIDLEGGTLRDEANASSKVGTAAADVSGGAPRQVAHFDSMPKPVALGDGSFAAYFIDHEGPGVAATPLEQNVYVRYSKDGDSWSEPEVVVPLPSDAGGFGYFVPLADEQGEVHIFALCDAGTGAVRPRPSGSGGPAIEPLSRQRLDVWHVKSLAGRSKWSTPRMVWQGRAGDLQSVTHLKSGRIVLPVSYYVDRSWSNRGEGPAQFTYNGQFDTTVLYSDDAGETWQQSTSVLRTPTPDLASYGAVEPVVLELEDGRVWMLLRTQLGRFYESFSKDGAEWSAASPSAITSSDSPAALSRLPDGRILMLWNNCQRHPYAQGSRHVLHAAVSADEGKTWRGYREILRDAKRDVPPPPSGDHGVSYPFMAVNNEGQALYSMWVQTGEGRSLEMFDPAWLEAQSASFDVSAGLEELSTFGTVGASTADDPVEAGKSVLSLARQSTEYPAAAVWNFPAGQSGELTFEVYRDAQTPVVQVELADHFSPPADEQSKYFSVFQTAIGAPGDGDAEIGVEPAKWTQVCIRWDGSKRVAQVGAVGGATTTIHQQHESAGPNYVRFVMPKGSVSPDRLLIRNLSVDLGAASDLAVATP
jgi:predicted neuraminidase